MIASASGLAALFLADERLRLVFTVISTTYLLNLAAKIAFAGSKLAFIEAIQPPGIWGGFALQEINPKAYVVGTFVYSNFPIWPQNLLVEIIIKFIIANAIWLSIYIIWLSAGVTINRLDLPTQIHRSINITMVVAMLIVVGLAVWSTMFSRTP